MTAEKKQNRLAFEKSPYLLQHSANPVDWYPWGEEAFDKAQRENKPVFLSIGYSTCHWCHVMAHESFEDHTVAKMMNDTLISVKVDREERPDIDVLYMAVCQMLTGSGGWPLTIVMTPDKQPFFAGTYIPKESRFGRTGMLDLIPRIKELWDTRYPEVINSASQIVDTLRKSSQILPGKELDESILHLAYRQLLSRFDEQKGGFSKAPKFPTVHNLLFLLRYWKRSGDKKALDMVEKTLQSMRKGGIFDHIGFGFHRYSTDEWWLVPHFEKMLYDQAMLTLAYIEAYQATKKEEYAQTARDVLTYVLRDMTAECGGFYSAEDADSEGEEGKFYLWTYNEIRDVLDPCESDLFIRLFNIKSDGHFAVEATGIRDRRNIPHITKSSEEITFELNMSATEFGKRIESARSKLFQHREKRVRPQKDDKILTDWNGLMVAALAKASQVFREPVYSASAKSAVDFILRNMVTNDGKLLHRYRQGEARLPAHIDDYAFLIYGLLELYEANFESYYLKKAIELNEVLIKHFWDEVNGGFYFTSDEENELIVRQKEVYDGAVPSGNSVAMLNLLRLGRLTADSVLEQKAAQIGRAFSENVRQSPSAFTQLMMAVDFAISPSQEIVVAGDIQKDDTKGMLRAIQQNFNPNKVVVLISDSKADYDIKRIVPFIAQMSPMGGRSTAYICQNYSCKLPTNDIETVLRLLGAN